MNAQEKRAWEIIREVLNDERYHYTKATIAENAPLALIQITLETSIATACIILDITLDQAKQKFAAEKEGGNT